MYSKMDVLKDILDNLNDSIIIIDPFGQIVLYNSEALRIQKSISEKPIQIGDYFIAIASPEHKDTVTEILKTIKRQKRTVKNFAEYNTPFGSTVYLEISFVPILGHKKELKYINIITQDITSRKIFESKMRAVSADVKNLIENANAIIFSMDSRGYIVEWNHHCSQITGFQKNEIYSKKLSEILVKEYNSPLFHDLMAAVLKNQSVGNYEVSILTKDGREIVVMLSATPRTNAHGQVIGATLVGQDITELTEYRRSLENLIEKKTADLQEILKKEKEAVEIKSRFVSIASHEFRTPLSSIDFAANFVKQNLTTIESKKLNEKMEVIEKHVHYMNHLLNDVLTYSKNEAGNIKLIPSKISLHDFSSSVLKEVEDNTKHSHKICLSANQLGDLETDEKLLRNIIINLLTNAIKFSPGREEIFLTIHDFGTHITFTVRDQGMGIPEDELEIIFEPFIRGKAAEAVQGTGLGLSIVKKAIELLHGTIRVQSTPAKGSVFIVTIPRAEAI
jgi:PAS domain S-box-containing protein